MKIGVLADIHEHVEYLIAALRLFDREQVDCVVVLGDICGEGIKTRETITPLIDVGAVGVWGNHELGLCVDPDPQVTAGYDEAVLKFLASLQPSLEIDGVLFSHGMPDWDATDPTAYYLGDGPFVPAALSNILTAYPNWLFLMGHFHRWFVAKENGQIDWDGNEVMQIIDRRAVIVGPVFRGDCAILDTTERLLTPYNVA